ncbi:MAG: outer membrane protein assembly factor BamC [Betaproteobacteria bacterium]|nr:outer membrane protein assembly factor BamC [Betaproteobacteria bacterium]
MLVTARQAGWWVACATLVACGTVMDTDKVNYKSQTDEPAKTSLEVPPDLTVINRNKRYEMPNGSFSANKQGEAKPLDSANITSPLRLADIQVKRAGSQMWLEISRPPEELWPLVRDFWKESGFVFVREEQKLGLMETEWAENRAKLPQDFIRRSLGKVLDSFYSTGERDKFRIRLERTISNGTELFVSHRGMIEVYADSLSRSTKWQPRPNDPELEKEFLRRIMLKLGPADPTLEKALTQAAVNSASQLIDIAGNPAVSFNQGFDITWRRVGVALDRNGFTVEDRDRKQGIYYVRFVDVGNGEEESLFSKWFRRSKDANQGPQQYRLKIDSANNSASTIQILNSSGQADNSPNAKKIAQLLVGELQ